MWREMWTGPPPSPHLPTIPPPSPRHPPAAPCCPSLTRHSPPHDDQTPTRRSAPRYPTLSTTLSTTLSSPCCPALTHSSLTTRARRACDHEWWGRVAGSTRGGPGIGHVQSGARSISVGIGQERCSAEWSVTTPYSPPPSPPPGSQTPTPDVPTPLSPHPSCPPDQFQTPTPDVPPDQVRASMGEALHSITEPKTPGRESDDHDHHQPDTAGHAAPGAASTPLWQAALNHPRVLGALAKPAQGFAARSSGAVPASCKWRQTSV